MTLVSSTNFRSYTEGSLEVHLISGFFLQKKLCKHGFTYHFTPNAPNNIRFSYFNCGQLNMAYHTLFVSHPPYSGHHGVHRSKKNLVMGFKVSSRTTADRCFAPLAWLLASPMFEMSKIFCWVNIFTYMISSKQYVVLIYIKPHIINTAFSWHCLNLHHLH